jgi:hypothetical protein
MYGHDTFKVKKKKRFVPGRSTLGAENSTYFTSGERQRLLKSIMERALTARNKRLRDSHMHSFTGVAQSVWPERLLDQKRGIRVTLSDFSGSAKTGMAKLIFPLHDSSEITPLRKWGTLKIKKCCSADGSIFAGEHNATTAYQCVAVFLVVANTSDMVSWGFQCLWMR